MATELTGKRPLVSMDQHVAVTVQLILELALADVAVIKQLPLAFPRHQAELVQGLLDLLVLRVMRVSDVLDEVLDVGVLLLAEAAVLLDLLVHPLDVHLEVALAQAGERAIVAGELLAGVLTQVHVEVGLDGTGVAALGALVWLFIGVDPQRQLPGKALSALVPLKGSESDKDAAQPSSESQAQVIDCDSEPMPELRCPCEFHESHSITRRQAGVQWRPRLTATSASRVQAILLPQPHKIALLQAGGEGTHPAEELGEGTKKTHCSRNHYSSRSGTEGLWYHSRSSSPHSYPVLLYLLTTTPGQ
ncbi:hypothetical protein AAY473_032088 [Plecturocebus cupreus]